VLALAACGGDGKETVTATVSTTPQMSGVRVYFLRDGNVQPLLAMVPNTPRIASAALGALFSGAPVKEHPELGLSTDIPAEAEFGGLAIDTGTARLDLPRNLSRPALAQVVYTLTQFPTVKAVEIAGKRYSRADFEEETPQILVESPLPLEIVRSPLRAFGTANTFEATFEYELLDAEGRILGKHFTTATSGSGTRGTFDFEQPFTVDRSGDGKLVVYELSADDGSRIHVVEIPIKLES
jgi:germination protein M